MNNRAPHHAPHHSAHPRTIPPPPSRLPGWAFTLIAVLVGGVSFGGYRAAVWVNRQINPPQEKRVIQSPINDAEWEAMIAGLHTAAGAWRANAGIYMRDMESGRTWEHNPDKLFPSASLIKLPIMASVMKEVKAGGVTLDAQMKLTRRERVGGSGSLKWVRDGTTLSVMEIVYKMITESDNTATRMMIDRIGMPKIAGDFRDFGLEHTNITEEGMSLKSGRVARENYTTAREMAGLLERIYSGELVDKESSDFMLDVLKHTKSRSRLRSGLPLGWEIGHKTGLLRRSCHDAGIVFSPRGDYVIVVLTSDVPDYSSAKKFIARLAGLTYKYYKLDADYAQTSSVGGKTKSI
jgi:beta-lactamase class A